MKKNTKLIIFIVAFCSVFSAVSVHADALLTSNSDLKGIISNAIGIMSSLVPLLIGAAVVVFLYGVLVFIFKSRSGDAEGHKEGINFMIYGIIGIAVMVSVWGLVAFVTTTLGTSSGTGAIPQFNASGGTQQTDYTYSSSYLPPPLPEPSNYVQPNALPAYLQR